MAGSGKSICPDVLGGIHCWKADCADNASPAGVDGCRTALLGMSLPERWLCAETVYFSLSDNKISNETPIPRVLDSESSGCGQKAHQEQQV